MVNTYIRCCKVLVVLLVSLRSCSSLQVNNINPWSHYSLNIYVLYFQAFLSFSNPVTFPIILSVPSLVQAVDTENAMAQPSSSPSSPIEPLDSGEKASSTPRTTIRKLEDPKSASEAYGPTTSISGALQDLLCGAFLPCLPVVLVSTLLLTLILYHRVDLDPGWELLQTPTSNNVSGISLLNHNLGPPGRGGHAAYYVRFNPAVLATIAAWSSKIIPYITGYLMTVIGFFAGRRILNASRNNEPGELPTPHQMSILIDLLGSASPKSLWSTIVYRWHNHERLFQPIPMAFGALSYIVIIT